VNSEINLRCSLRLRKFDIGRAAGHGIVTGQIYFFVTNVEFSSNAFEFGLNVSVAGRVVGPLHGRVASISRAGQFYRRWISLLIFAKIFSSTRVAVGMRAHRKEHPIKNIHISFRQAMKIDEPSRFKTLKSNMRGRKPRHCTLHCLAPAHFHVALCAQGPPECLSHECADYRLRWAHRK
jgi:hypothetical protein